MASGNIRLSEAVEYHLNHRRAHCAPTTERQEACVARRFIAAIGDLYVANLRPAHVARFFLALLDEHITRDGRTRPAIRASTWNYLYARLKSMSKYLRTRLYAPRPRSPSSPAPGGRIQVSERAERRARALNR